jgi:hypothetical protein
MGMQRAWLAALAAVVGATMLYRAKVRPWMYTWGARGNELTAKLPGDELVEAATPSTTRAVTVKAPVEAVWPWLVQIGEDRGGFYSYSLLERAVGAHMHNADTVHPEWQERRVGDTVWLGRRYGELGRQVVAAVEPKSHLVLVSPKDFDRIQNGGKASGTWAFYLRPQNGRTRLLARGSGGAVGHAAFDIPHYVMEQKMLRGIRDRAERAL